MPESNEVISALAEIDAARDGSYAIVTVDADRNLYAQFLAEGVSGLHAELVGNDYLDTADQLTLSQQVVLRQRGWKGDGEANWSREWNDASTDAARRIIVLESIGALAEVFGAAGEVNVEVTIEKSGDSTDSANTATASRVVAVLVGVAALIIGLVMMLFVAGSP